MSDAISLCRTCNLNGKDCCHSPHPIFVGILEAVKIHLERGLKYSDFLIYTKFDEDQFLDAFVELIPNGKIIALKRREFRKCVFYTKNGCKIPHLKPFICKVFPFWYDQDIYKQNKFIELIIEDRDCLLRNKILEFETIDERCRFMGYSEEEMKNFFKIAFKHYELYNKYDFLFEIYDIDTAFLKIERELQVQFENI